MAAEYEKKTVVQLQELLKARNLATNGKKAELIARLQNADKSATEAPEKGAKADAVEDVIDWDDDVPTGGEAPKETTEPTTEASAASLAAGGAGQVSNPVAVPNQTLAEDPAKTSDLHVKSQGGATGGSEDKKAEEKPAVDYSIGLQATDLEAELQKRKARAAKFGIVAETNDKITESEKALERAKRFGTGESAPTTSGLDQALPERSHKRGRGDNQGGRAGKRRNAGGNTRRRARNNGPSDKGNNQAGRSNAPKPVFSDKDKAAMEARKKRFAAAA